MTTNAHRATTTHTSPDERALNDRQAAILEAVVTEYIGERGAGRVLARGQRPGRAGLLGHGALGDGGARAGRATWCSPTPVPGASPPTRATASSWTI